MNHLKKTSTMLTLLTLIIGLPTFAQDFFKFASAEEAMREFRAKARAKEVMQDNEYYSTSDEQGIFLSNPLQLDGKPLDYGIFGLRSKGELTLVKIATLTGQTKQVPFYLYLRREGNTVLIPGSEKPNPKQIKINLSEVLAYAKPGDQLIIEPIIKEDGPAKRILKLLENGC